MEKKVFDLGSLGKKPDDRMSKDEMLEKCLGDIQWLVQTIFGMRDEKGNLVKDVYKDKDGAVKNSTYQVGLMHKIEGVWEYDEEAKKPVLRQQGLEGMFSGLVESHNLLANVFRAEVLELKVQQVIIFMKLGIKPEELADTLVEKESEINTWLGNFHSRIKQNMEKLKKEDEATAEKLKQAGAIPK